MSWLWNKLTDLSDEALLREVTLAIGQVLGHSSGKSPLPPSSFLGADLGLSSIAVARLVGILQKRCSGKPLPFHALFVKPDGTMLHDLRVSDIITFLQHHLQGATR